MANTEDPGGRRIARQGEDDREVPGRRLRRPGFLRPHPRPGQGSRLGVDVEHDFVPDYVVPEDSKKHVAELKKALKGSDDVILATDYDREGEAIAYHVATLLGVDPTAGQAGDLHRDHARRDPRGLPASARDRPAAVRRAGGSPHPGPPGRGTGSRRSCGSGSGRACRRAACSRWPCASSSSASARSGRSSRWSTGASTSGSPPRTPSSPSWRA